MVEIPIRRSRKNSLKEAPSVQSRQSTTNPLKIICGRKEIVKVKMKETDFPKFQQQKPTSFTLFIFQREILLDQGAYFLESSDRSLDISIKISATTFFETWYSIELTVPPKLL